VCEMKRNVSVVRFKFRCNILISGKIIKEMPGSVANGTHCIRMDLQEVGCGYMDWIGLAQDRDGWRTLVSAVMSLRVP